MMVAVSVRKCCNMADQQMVVDAQSHVLLTAGTQGEPYACISRAGTAHGSEWVSEFLNGTSA